MQYNRTEDEEITRTVIIVDEMELIRALTGNDKKRRDRYLKSLRKRFDYRNRKMPFTKDDFKRIWKGLFYATWMSDTPLIQVACVEIISQVIHFTTPESSLLFFKCGLEWMSTEWFDSANFLMLVRSVLRQGLDVLKRNDWSLEAVGQFNNVLLETVLKKDNITYLGLALYVIEIYLEELAKVSNGSIKENIMTELLRPFVKYLSILTSDFQIFCINKFMFHYLIRQSEQGIEYKTKFEAWKERVEADVGGELEEAEEELQSQVIPLDPTGHVDIELPQLKFDALEVSELMHEVKFGEGSTTKARKAITKLELEFEKLSSGVYPFAYKKFRPPEYDAYSKKQRKLLNDSSKNRSRKRKNVDEVQVKSKRAKLDSVDFSQDKLLKFTAKSKESLLKGPNKRSLKSNKTKKVLHSNPEKKKGLKLPASYRTLKNHFRSNSGTWIVTPINSIQTKMVLLSSSEKKKELKLQMSNRTFKNHLNGRSGTGIIYPLDSPIKKPLKSNIKTPINSNQTIWFYF